MSAKLLMKEIKNLIKKIKKLSNGQAKILEIEDDMTILQIQIKPDDGFYKGGTFIFEIEIDPDTFQTLGPDVTCKTPIYHPNIRFRGTICVSLLDEWKFTYGLDDLVIALLFLFHNPNLEDPNNGYIFIGMSSAQLKKNVRASLLGKMKLYDVKFPKNFEEDQSVRKTTKRSKTHVEPSNMVLRKRTKTIN